MKKAIKIIAFLAILALLLTGVSGIMKFKYVDGIYSLTSFYKLPENSCDVMFFGTSHTFEGINPAMIWKETGIPSFVLAGSSQPLWSTYYYIKEALKYQSPKVVVLDIDSTFFKGEYSDYSRIVKNTIGLRLSIDKINAIKVSAPPEQWADILLGLPTYHTRYDELSEQDFTGEVRNYPQPWMGYCEHTGHASFGTPDVSDITETRAMTEKVEYWFRQIIELCRSEGVTLQLISIPYSITDVEQMTYLYAENIAKKYGISLINFNVQQELVQINYAQDLGDDQHLNYKGSTKMSTYIAHYLADTYSLEDKRGSDNIYGIWDENLAYDIASHMA